MKGCEYTIVVVLYFSSLWWSCVCDSTSDIPLMPQNEVKPTASQEQILNSIGENLNSELVTIADDITVDNDVLETQENVYSISIENSESLESDKLEVFGQNVQESDSNSQNPNTDPSQGTASTDVDIKTSKDSSLTAEVVHGKKVEAQPAEAVTSEAKGVDHPPLPTVTLESPGSQSVSSSPVDATVREEAAAPAAADSNLPEQDHPPSEEMPLFDEWKKMMLAGQEEGDQKALVPGPTGKKLASQKRRRNYASSECGAKIVASNAEAEGTSRILTELADEYMLNPCQAKVWFVIELCESVQASQIELANFELFSSLPKAFAVYSSSSFPTRDWLPLGLFTAAEQRVLQSFPLKQEGYGKFIKIEMQSHYGNEYYCPLSIVRIFGTSMVDEYEEMETLSTHPVLPDDDLDRIVDLPVEHKSPTTIFGSATDAVYNIVKKAARALLPHQQVEGESSEKMDHNVSEAKHCELKDKSCHDEKSGKLSKATDFLASVTSVQPALFNHLRRCEQCVKTSKPSYHSISEPQCRFFQAAMGPVLFTSICDWFRDHHLTTITRHQMPILDISENTTSSVNKISPPPVIRVIIETNQSESFPLPTVTNSSLSEKTEGISVGEGELTSGIKVFDSPLSEGLKVESEIKPTKTTSVLPDGSRMDLGKETVVDPLLVSKEDSDRSLPADVHPVVDEVPVPDLPPVPTISGTEEIISPTLTAPTPEPSDLSNETKMGESFEITGEEVTVIPSTMDVTTDDLTEAFKTAEEMKDPGVKLETIAVGGLSSQKESVFIRMNHRIKALELNMSLSSQYLQELSRRYRRQMEEMQRSFNRTIATLNDTARKAAERDLKQQEAIETLQAQVANLTLIVDQLVSERSAVMQKMLEVHLFLMVVEAIVMITILSLCVRRISSAASTQHPPLMQSITPIAGRKRHNSTDSSGSRTVPKIKKRSSSEEVISPDNELLIIEPAAPLPKGKKKNKKKKGIRRSASNPSMSPSKETAPAKKYNKERSSAAGIIFTHAATQQLAAEPENSTRSCENCIRGSSRKLHEKSYASTKQLKRNSSPLKNLTNGDLEQYKKPVVRHVCSPKEKFNIRKFLRFQKRESI